MYNHTKKVPLRSGAGPLLWITCITLLSFSTHSAAQQQLLILNRSSQAITAIPFQERGASLSRDIAHDLSDPYDVLSDPSTGQLFLPDGAGHRIQQVTLRASEKKPDLAILTNMTGFPVDLDLDPIHRQMYWVDNAGKAIVRANLDGSRQEIVPTDSLANPSALALIPALDLLFYADLDRNQIWSSTLSGTQRKVLVHADAEYPVRLAADAVHGKLYWVNDGEHLIERINFDGSGREVFYQGLENEFPFGLMIDPGSSSLYWTDYGTDQVLRAGLNHPLAVPEVIASGLADPYALALADLSVLTDADDLSQSSRELKPAVTLFPNPANQRITLQSLNNTQSIEWVRVYDRIGNEVYFGKSNDAIYHLDIDLYADGYYSYSAQVAGQILSGHFSIIH